MRVVVLRGTLGLDDRLRTQIDDMGKAAAVQSVRIMGEKTPKTHRT